MGVHISYPAAEAGMVEAVDAAATVVGVKVVADEVGRFAKLKAPPVLAEVSDGITKPVQIQLQIWN
jgi:hypothetical protein